MKITTDLFFRVLRDYIQDEVIPQFPSSTVKFVAGMALPTIHTKVLPMLESAGVVAGNEVDLEVLSTMVSSGFKFSGDKLSMDLPGISLFGSSTSSTTLTFTPQDWAEFLRRF